MNKSPLFYAITLAATIFGANMALAANEAPAPAPAAVITPSSQAPITKEQAAEMALKLYPGRVTEVDDDQKDGKEAWEVKIKGNDGKEWEVYYDKATGELIDSEED